ncbi:hypothetical protein ACFQI7_27415 [Paenibacillus allorhizosphaerae]|uniref:DUF5050 domain-containing protein n=1 Tax=Paenibacillus allorhizosphaerae TaxID=2849866 RepID=A0ABM8VNH3_9BACL|nr:hypothetical protein [Paenibacillus allorhizosphaerae]CAG7651350.1 hypothetical protein PAECIP111802_04941 [Paenibacillus allorhizosphaerae]
MRKPLIFLAIAISLAACSPKQTQQTAEQTKNNNTNVTGQKAVNEAPTQASTQPAAPFVLKETIRQVGVEGFTDLSLSNATTNVHLYEKNGVIYTLFSASDKFYVSAAKDNKWIYKDKVLDDGSAKRERNPIPGGFFYFDKNVLNIKQIDQDQSIKEISLGSPNLGQPWGLGIKDDLLTSEGYAFVVRDEKVFKLYLLKDMSNPITIPNLNKMNASEFRFVNFANNTIITMSNDKFNLFDLKTGEPQYDQAGQPIRYPFLKGDIIGMSEKGQWVYIEREDDKVKLGYLNDQFKPTNLTTIDNIPPSISLYELYKITKNELTIHGSYEFKGKPSAYTVKIQMN